MNTVTPDTRVHVLLNPTVQLFDVQVRFGYSPGSLVFGQLNINADMDSRIALVSIPFWFYQLSVFVCHAMHTNCQFGKWHVTCVMWVLTCYESPTL